MMRAITCAHVQWLVLEKREKVNFHMHCMEFCIRYMLEDGFRECKPLQRIVNNDFVVHCIINTIWVFSVN